jgi:hypothetical protein
MILPSRIEVYVKIEKVGVRGQKSDRPVTDAFQPRMSRWGWTNVEGKPAKTEEVMSESDKAALDCAQEFAESKGLPIEICDINTSKGKIKAWMKGVKTTPTILIGKSRVEGRFTLRQLKNKLENFGRTTSSKRRNESADSS